MRLRHAILALLVLTATLLAACSGNKASNPEPRTTPVSIDEVRRYAQKALDGMSSSDDREQAREAAVRSLLELLKNADSTRIAKADWERPVTQGNTPMVRVFEAGKLKVFGFPLPGPGVVPPGERVIVQFSGTGGTLLSEELPTMSGGKLTAAKALEEGGQTYLSLAFTLARGGGYVGHYQLDARAGEFKASSSAFKGLPTKVGDLTLEPRDQFLTVNMPNPDDWRPQFDPKQPLRLFFNGDIALEWKGGKYLVLDERNFSAFAGLKLALDPKTPKADRDEAWEKGTRKLPSYLQEMASWNEDLTAKLPEGAVVLKDQVANLGIRIVSIPAPEGSKDGFTVVQYRAGGGLPQAQALAVPGKAEAVRLITRQGLPGLMILSGSSEGPKGPMHKYVSLLRMTAGNDWQPAADWFGWLPGVDGWELRRTTAQHTVEIMNTVKPEAFTATLTPGVDPSVQLCQSPTACYSLTWVSDQLSGGNWIAGKLSALTAPGAVPSPDQVLQAAGLVQSMLAAPELKGLEAPQVAAMLGGQVQVLEPEPGTLVVGFPGNGSGTVPVLVQGGSVVLRDLVTSHIVDRWIGARIVETGADKWLLMLGQGKVSAALLVYKWDGKAWQPAPPLSGSVDRSIGETVRVTYAAGQDRPVRGLYAGGSADITAAFTPDGKGVSFCEGKRACLTYIFDNQWVLR